MEATRSGEMIRAQNHGIEPKLGARAEGGRELEGGLKLMEKPT